MKNTRKILVALVLVLTLLVGMTTIFASAANIPGGTKLYLVPNSNWNQSNARFAAYFFGDGEAWVSMTKVAGESNLYEVTVPAGKNFTNVIFCRMNPSASANNWNNKWNQTADLVYNGTSNCYTIKAGTWDKGGGTWSSYGSSCAHANVGPAATCTTAQVCKDCNDPVVEALGHTYNSSNLCTRCNEQAPFTVAGSGAHMGTEWDTGNTANDMTYADGVYTKVYTNVAAGSYALKVVRDHDWGTAYPSADKAYTVATSGSTVTVTLKGTTVTVTVEAPHVHSYFYPCDKVCMECFEESNPDATHTIVHVEAKAPTCTEYGNAEYWYCSDCGYAWLDAECTVQANQMSVRLGATCATNAIHSEGVEPGCHYTGWTENWYCANCDVYYLDAACTIITNYKSLTISALQSTAEYVPAKAATCYEDGNVEYWVCYECEQVWANEALTQLTNIKNVQIAMAHAEATHVEAKAPTTTANGNLEYWYCAECGQAWLDEACTRNTNLLAVILPMLEEDAHVHSYFYPCDKVCMECFEESNPDATHTIVHVEAKAPTCTEYGNAEYWYCSDCGYAWLDAECTVQANQMSVRIGATCATNAIHNEGVEAGCHYTGWIENWYCANCDVYYLDAACTIITNYRSLTIPALKDSAEYVPAKAPTCTENGNVEYWVCYDCEQVWANEALTQLTNIKNVQVAPTCATGVIHTEGIAPGCHYTGWTENWYCPTCDVYYLDAACTMVTNYKNLTIPALQDTAEHIEAKEATCYENGNVEYWVCYECEQVWADEALTQLTNIKNVQKGMTHLEATHVEAKAPTCYENGNIEYWYCEACGQAWLDAECTRNTNLLAVVLPMAHAEATHVEAKAPTCYENGNIEHWYCAECGQAWLDEACTLNTNLKAVVLPMAHAEATHVEAKAATCYENGNIEYWYCEACGQAWLDEACTLNTNLKAVVLPMAHAEATHVEAKAPTTTENGNIEYWYCEACGQAWLDADCTLNTNLKAVVLPMIVEDEPVDTPDETPDETPSEPVVELNFFQRIWLAIINFFKKLFGLI